MPAILTHEFFGRDTYEGVAADLGFLSSSERDAFFLGNQGPDPLFYLELDPRAKEQDVVGRLMHRQRPAALLASLHDALSMLPQAERPVAKAYAAGFLCHYLLDSAVHPLVFSEQYGICDAGVEGLDRTDGRAVHAEIERDLDEMVLYVKSGTTIEDFLPFREVLIASDETLKVIDKLFFYMNLWSFSRTVTLDCYTRAVKSFRLAQRALYTPAGIKGRVIAPIERLVDHARYSQYRAMAHRVRPEARSDFENAEHLPWVNPFTAAVSHESFWDLYERARASVPTAVGSFFAEDFDEESAQRLTGNLNFFGQPVDPEVLEDPPVPAIGVTLGADADA